ncbi:OsmC family protein [Phenylobacterium sp.]|uniref:OsmC family protein n=1 Tax=Phenylobacterium sp. TaxID=1871053 RepID=UPI0035615BE4
MPADPILPIDGETVLVSETGNGRLQMLARTGAAEFLIDEPASVGGLGSGPNPYDLLSAALGACTTMTLRLYAERKGWPLTKVEVSVLHHRASLEARDRFDRTISLEGPLDEAQKAQLLQIAERCPVHRTLDRGADVRTALNPAAKDAEPSLATPSEHMRDMEEACAD